METGERLSAYLAGELDADETAAVEADLAGDPALRAQLDRIRTANDALASLPAVSPSAAFSARLRETLRDDIAQRADGTPAVDELAHKRLQRTAGHNRFVGIGIAAAAAAVVAGIGLTSLFGTADDAATVADGDPQMAQEGAGGDPLAPFVRVTDTDHDAESVAALAEEDGVLDIPGEVGQGEARTLEEDRYAAFGLSGDDSASLRAGGTEQRDAEADAAAEADAETETSAPASGPAPETAEAGASGLDASTGAPADPFTDVRRCLPEIVSTASQPVIPLFAEVAAYEGEPAIIYLVLTREPDARMFNRIEAWVVSRADCFILNFQQVSR